MLKVLHSTVDMSAGVPELILVVRSQSRRWLTPAYVEAFDDCRECRVARFNRVDYVAYDLSLATLTDAWGGKARG